MLWIALTPFLLLGLAMAVVPLVVGMYHQHRAGEAGGERALRRHRELTARAQGSRNVGFEI